MRAGHHHRSVPRTNSHKRRKGGKTTELKVLAANNDLALGLSSLDWRTHFYLRP
jgi:hypothetical protein